MFNDIHNELQKHWFSPVLEGLYSLLRGKRKVVVAHVLFRYFAKLEGGHYRSYTIRKLMSRDYKIDIGVHSYGEVFRPGAFGPEVKMGKYCSVARDVKVITENHPLDHISTHPYFYNSSEGFNDKSSVGLTIGHDVWIGHGAIILPGCKSIGDGAVIGAGSVVTADVQAYGVVGGVPAKRIKKRISEEKIGQIYQDPWWDKSVDSLKEQGLIR